MRAEILAGRANGTGAEERVAERLAALERPSLRRVINATGVVLHTNLGRAPLGAWNPLAGLLQPGVRSRGRTARQARHAHRRPAGAAAGRAGDRRQQQRRGHLAGSRRTGGGGRSGGLARRADRDWRRLPHPRHHGAVGRRHPRGGHHQPHRRSTITGRPSAIAPACCCASIPAISACRASPRAWICASWWRWGASAASAGV